MGDTDSELKNVQKRALLLVSHGVSSPYAQAARRVHSNLVSSLQETGEFKEIHWGYLTCDPLIEDALASFEADTVYVLPMLMSDGYFSRQMIPDKLGLEDVVSILPTGQKVIQCRPVGLSKLMGDVMIKHMTDYCADNELDAENTSVVVVGHGSSQNDASRLATSTQVEHINHTSIFREAHAAYLEEMPDLPMVLKGLDGPTLIMGYFANCGLHATKDVPKILEASRHHAIYLGPVGVLGAIKGVVLDCVAGVEAN
mgnify:CR=1 FL=1